MKTIRSFSGEYAFLSNFYAYHMNIDSGGTIVGVPTLEHAFQALKAKTKDECDWVLASSTPGISKKRGRKVSCWSDWNDIRDNIMLELLRIKFSEPEMAEKLLATGLATLVEGNTWGDTYWGVCRGVGENMLGTLLMQVRGEIRRGEVFPPPKFLEFATDYYTEA